MKQTLYIFAILLLLPACGKQNEESVIVIEENTREFEAALFEAAEDGNLEKVKELLSKGVDVNSKDNNGLTPLHHAAERDKGELVEFLINEGAYVNARDNEGNTPLHKAFGLMCLGDSVKSLLDKGADPKARNKDGETPLHFAVLNPRWPVSDTVDALISAGADINAKDESGNTPLDKAVRGFWPGIIAHLRENSAKAGKTAGNLFEAVKYGDIEIMKLLLAVGADVNVKDNPRKNTVLHYAALLGEKEIAALLVAAGAQVDARSRFGTPLHYALKQGHEDMARLLMDKGADVTKNYSEGDHHFETPLHLAVASGNVELVGFLFTQGLEVNVRNYWQEIPLHTAVLHGFSEIAELLIAEGADVNALRIAVHPEIAITPLDMAIARKDAALEKLLRSHGAKLWKDLRQKVEPGGEGE